MFGIPSFGIWGAYLNNFNEELSYLHITPVFWWFIRLFAVLYHLQCRLRNTVLK
jgi:hypothetical protein